MFCVSYMCIGKNKTVLCAAWMLLGFLYNVVLSLAAFWDMLHFVNAVCCWKQGVWLTEMEADNSCISNKC